MHKPAHGFVLAEALALAFAVLLLALLLLAGPRRLEALEPVRPNIVLIVADDLGAMDLGVTGSAFHETPRLDQLARQGVLFSGACSAATICSPSRAALATGKHPARLHLTDWIPGHDFPGAKLRPPEWTQRLLLEETTVAERLRAAGYATWHIGKWHLGGEGFGPLEQGFDVNLGGDHRGQPPSYFSPYGLPRLADGPAGEYLTDREGAEAERLIREHQRTAKGRPFFLDLSFHAPHRPLQAKPELVEKYRRKLAEADGGPQRHPVYAGMLESIDRAVGRVLDTLEEAGLAGQTLVIFTSDNGGLVLGQEPPTSNAPLRAGKGSPYEGGVRVPLIVRWPGQTATGAVCPHPVISMDVAATVLEAAGVQVDEKALDGTSLVPWLEAPALRWRREALFWHYPHYHPGGATPYASLRAGDWKLLESYEDGRLELYDLRADPGETKSLAGARPDVTLELSRRLFAAQGEADAQWPRANPAYRPEPLAAGADGAFELHARSASVHGRTLRYEPQPFKDTLGWWSDAGDWPSWSLKVEKPGIFDVELLQGCGAGQGGSRVAVELADQSITFTVEETGHFQSFVARRVGRVSLTAPGPQELAVRPLHKAAGAIMDLRRVRLLPAPAGPEPPPGALSFLAAPRIVILGDSITYSGEWAEVVEAYLRLQFPEVEWNLLNLGLPSETVSGLSEPGHAGGAFPRPALGERLERVLERAKPDLLLACYGMNDGIYHPLDEARFGSFREGITRLRESAARRGVRVIHLTPPVFDALPLAGRTLPAGLAEYRAPFEGYDEVLTRYSSWLLEQRAQGWEVIDLHGPMRQLLTERRKTEPGFHLAGDGVHVSSRGHWILAREVLRHLGAPQEVLRGESAQALTQLHPRAAQILELAAARQRALKDAWLTHVGHLRPGMARAKPLAEAELEAAEITTRLRTAAAR